MLNTTLNGVAAVFSAPKGFLVWLANKLPEPELDDMPDWYHDSGCNRINCRCDNKYL